MNTLLVCSKSTRKFLQQYNNVRIVLKPPTVDILKELNTEENVIAIGGGSVIDTAKIISKKPITCYPTTASGSSATSWAVYWGKNDKYSQLCDMPEHVFLNPKFMEGIPQNILNHTIADALSHCLDSLNSLKSTEISNGHCALAMGFLSQKENKEAILKAGHIAGKAIQITGTNLLHSLSYPMTIHYGIPHGKALLYLLPRLSEYMGYNIYDIITNPIKKIDYIDFSFVVNEAIKYDKIYESRINISANILKDILRD